MQLTAIVNGCLLLRYVSALDRGILGFALGTKKPDGSCKTTTDYEADFDRIKANTCSTLVRGYSASNCDSAENMLHAAKTKGFQVILAVWPNTEESFVADKQALSNYATTYSEQVYAVTVGSETLYRKTFTGPQLLARINEVKQLLPGAKVGTTDTWNKLADGTADALINGGITLLLANAFSYWQGKDVGAGAEYTYFDDNQQALDRVQELSGSLDAIEFCNGETGWPTDVGTRYGAAVASRSNTVTFHSQGVCGMLAWRVNVSYFEAFDDYVCPAVQLEN